MFKNRLVQFHNGTYGVRSYWFFGWHFLDLYFPRTFTWTRGSRLFVESCTARDKDKAVWALNQVRRKEINYKFV